MPLTGAKPVAPGAGPSPAAATGTVQDRSPLAPQGNGGAAAAGVPAPSAAETGLPDELALGDIFPSDATTAPAAAHADAAAPTGPAPAGDAIADYGHAPHSHWPLVAGAIVSLLVLLGGGGFVWWRNRDSRYWPA